MPLAPIAEDSVVTRIRSIAVEAWLPVLLVGLWWFVSSSSSSFYFPPLREIMTRFADLWFSDQFVVHVVPSLRNFGIGFLLGVTIGILCGLALGSSRRRVVRCPRHSNSSEPHRLSPWFR